MRYTIVMTDNFVPTHEADHVYIIERGLTRTQAWSRATKHARRGLRLYGGSLKRYPWGMRAGDIYLSAEGRPSRAITIFAENAAHWAPYPARSWRRLGR